MKKTQLQKSHATVPLSRPAGLLVLPLAKTQGIIDLSLQGPTARGGVGLWQKVLS